MLVSYQSRYPLLLLILSLGVSPTTTVWAQPAPDPVPAPAPQQPPIPPVAPPLNLQPGPATNPESGQPLQPPTRDGEAGLPPTGLEAPSSANDYRPPTPPTDQNRPTPTRRRRSRQRSLARLSRMPEMFGDVFSVGSLAAQTNVNFVQVGVPLAGGSRRVKIAEHNRATPSDRFLFSYNHFHNALPFSRAVAPGAPPFLQQDFSIDRFTLGFEKSFRCNRWSVEVRMPFTERFAIDSSSPMLPLASDFSMTGGSVGDLSVVTKHLLWSDNDHALSAGLGVTAPTGSDVTVQLPLLAVPAQLEIENEAVHLLPFVAYSGAPGEKYFYHAFAQLDIAANGNRTIVTDALGARTEGLLNEQNVLYLDVSLGRWLYRDPCSRICQGIALSGELHYTTTLQNADIVGLFPVTGGFGAVDNRFDVLNATAGLHWQFPAATSLRFAGVFPVKRGDDRFFDAEVQVALIRGF